MRRLDDLPQDCHLSVNHSKVKIFIDICNSAKTMLLGKGLSLAVGRGHGFISIIKSSARVESLARGGRFNRLCTNTRDRGQNF